MKPQFDKDFVFPVYIFNFVLNEIKELSKSSLNEIFGYLIGLILSWKGKKYIIIEDQIHLKDSINSGRFKTSYLEGSAGNYVKEYYKLKVKNENLLVVGWWHSHINLGCFLSSVDIKTQEIFFPKSYQVALVVDPVREEYKFFSLDLNSISKYKPVSNAIII